MDLPQDDKGGLSRMLPDERHRGLDRGVIHARTKVQALCSEVGCWMPIPGVNAPVVLSERRS